jgi:hypothetical protein
MEADKERLEDTRDWLVKAERDLRAGEILVRDRLPPEARPG